MFWNLIFYVQVLKFGSPSVWFKPFILKENLQVLSALLIVGLSTWGGEFMVRLCSSFPHPLQCVLFLFVCFHLPDV